MIELETLPRQGQLAINVQVTADMNITAFTARQKTTRFAATQISTHMHGGEPRLIIKDRIVWRVPIILSMAPHGDMGVVGELDVDVETGATAISEQLIEEIKQRARHLATHPPQTATAVG